MEYEIEWSPSKQVINYPNSFTGPEQDRKSIGMKPLTVMICYNGSLDVQYPAYRGQIVTTGFNWISRSNLLPDMN